MYLKIVSWNVRGINDVSKRMRVRNLLKQWKADLARLHEAKSEYVSKGLLRNMWKPSC